MTEVFAKPPPERKPYLRKMTCPAKTGFVSVLLYCLFCTFLLLPAWTPAPVADGSSGTSAHCDTSFFAALVKSIVPSGFSREGVQPLRVDPRLMKNRTPGGDGLIDSLSMVRRHEKTLQHLDVPSANFSADDGCAFIEGLPSPRARATERSDTLKQSAEERCEKLGDFVSVIFSQPKPADEVSCSNAAESGSGTCYWANALEVTPYSSYWGIVFLWKTQQGEWTVERTKTLLESYS